MSLVTNWGYTLTEVNQLTNMLTTQEFDTFTANRYSGDTRTSSEIGAACAAIRDYVGWHLYPSAACELNVVIDDRRIALVGRDLLIQLPAKFVSAVTSVTINEVTYDHFRFETNGILRVYDVPCNLQRYTPVVIEYTAGLTDAMMAGIKELIAHRVTHAEASSNGITSEAAGGVSVTYNVNWVNSARATALPDDNKEVLQPFRVQGVF